MPKKGHRAASRQAQIQKKRRRAGSRTQVFDAGPSEADVAARQAHVDDDGEAAEAALAPRPAPAPARRPRTRAVADAAPKYPTIRPELTRIGILTFAVVVVLAVLTVFLG